jgi:hypothetical protein
MLNIKQITYRLPNVVIMRKMVDDSITQENFLVNKQKNYTFHIPVGRRIKISHYAIWLIFDDTSGLDA